MTMTTVIVDADENQVEKSENVSRTEHRVLFRVIKRYRVTVNLKQSVGHTHGQEVQFTIYGNPAGSYKFDWESYAMHNRTSPKAD